MKDKLFHILFNNFDLKSMEADLFSLLIHYKKITFLDSEPEKNIVKVLIENKISHSLITENDFRYLVLN